MTLEEAKERLKNYSGNINLQWFVCKWNGGYIIHSSNHMRQHPNTPYVYSTGNFKQIWTARYDESIRAYRHVVN